MNWTTSCHDWERRIINRESLIPPPLFVEEAEAALAVFKELRVVDLPGQPTMGEVCRPWVFDFVRAIFGAYDADEGRRLISEFLLLVAKKNTKSTLAAGIMLTALIRNWRPYAEAYILAPTIEVANNSFIPAKGMIDTDEELKDLFHVQSHLRTITHRANESFLKVVAADSDTVSGKKGSFILLDELWLFGKQQKAENMLREACGGLASRPEGFVISLSTMSDEPPAGIFQKKLNYARGVRDGKIDDKAFLPVLYEFPAQMLKKGDHKKPENFYITNPNLGTSVDIPFLERQFRQAENDGADSLAGFMAKHLNVEMGMALKSARWAGADFWENQGAGITLDQVLERCEVVVIGGDGGGLDDMLGIAVLGREKETRHWLLWNKAWIHPIALERRKENAQLYKDFHAEGDLVIVDGVGQDVEQFGEIVKKCENSGLLDRIGVDPSGIGDIVDEIEGLGLDNDRVVGVSQGWRLNGAIKTTERKLAEGTLFHSGAPLMAWCASNARVEPKGNAILITKQASGTGKIDPIMATLCAVALMAMNPEAKSMRSKYEDSGLVVF